MKLSTVAKGALFIWLILMCSSSVAESMATQSNGEERASCCSGQLIQFNEIPNHICEKLQENLRIECWRFRARTFRKVEKCSKWCDKFAHCFDGNETDHWARQCSAMFSQSSPCMNATATDHGVLHVKDTLHVHRCRPFRKNVFVVVTVPGKESVAGTAGTRNGDEPPSPSQYPSDNVCSLLNNIRSGEKNAAQTSIQRAVSVLNTTMQELRGIPSEDKDDLAFTMDEVEDIFITLAEEKLNETSPTLEYENNQFDFRVRRVFMRQRNVSEFVLNGPKGNYMKIPSRNFQNDSVVLGVTYNNIHELFISNHSADINKLNQTRWLNTIIMSAVIHPSREVLLENVTLVFESIKAAGNDRECVFWNSSEENTGGWSGKGCLTRIINSSLTECLCNHLTHFAVLMNWADSGDSGDSGDSADSADSAVRADNRGPTFPSKKDDKILTTPKKDDKILTIPKKDDKILTIPKKDDKILTILTLVGMSLSLTGVVSTIISYLLLTDRDTPLSHIRVSLATAIGAGHVIFFAGIDATGNKSGCVAVAALLQYFLMAALCWMLVEGIYLYLFVVKVYNIVDKMRVYQAISWGLPAVIVASSLGIAAGKDGIQSFVNDKYCWISSDLIWIFIAFVGLIELLNTFILIRVIKEMMTMQHAKENQSEQIRLSIKAFVVLVPLLGVTWLFGFLSGLHVAFNYIFVILNSTQGFFIFVLHCLRNKEIRERFKRRFQRKMPHSENRTTRTGRAVL